MQNLIFLIVFTLFSLAGFSQTGVNFEDLTFDEALAKAKASRKLLLVDCYTSWCGPCKKMTNSVLTQEKAGAYFNPRFVSVKFDMEKGEGIELAKRFQVKSFPTFLVIRPDGRVQHKVVGGGGVDDFIGWIDRGMHKKTSYTYLEGQYAKGVRSKKMLYDYQEALILANEGARAQLIRSQLAPMLTDKEKLEGKYWRVIQDQPYGSEMFQFVLAHLEEYRQAGTKGVDFYLSGRFNGEIDDCFLRRGSRTEEEIGCLAKQLAQDIASVEFDRKEYSMNKLDLLLGALDKNIVQVLAAAEKVARKSQGNDTWIVLSVLEATGEYATKEELQQVIAFRPMLKRCSPGKMQERADEVFERLKMLACTGVYFQDLTFQEALEKADKENKLLFIDCYTSWCGPCKRMVKQVFPQESVGAYMNERFICVKYDMEKGEGPVLAEHFGVKYFPTFLYIQKDGVLRHKFVGASGSKEFISKSEEAFDETKGLGYMAVKFAAGNRDKALLSEYLPLLCDCGDPICPEVAGELVKVLSDQERLAPEYWYIFERPHLSPRGSFAENHLLAHRDAYDQAFGKEKVDRRLYLGYWSILTDIFGGRMENKTPEELDEMRGEVVNLKLETGKIILSYIAVARAMKSDNIDRVLTACEKEFPKLKSGQIPKKMFQFLYESRATEAQKARWERLLANIKN